MNIISDGFRSSEILTKYYVVQIYCLLSSEVLNINNTNISQQ